MSIQFISSGCYLGSKIESNAEVADRLGIEENEIVAKSGILQRYKELQKSSAEMGAAAIGAAVKDDFSALHEIDGLVVTSFTNDYIFPNLSSQIVKILQIEPKRVLDIQMNCAGLQAGLAVAHDMINSNKDIKKVAVVGIAKQSPYLNPLDPNTAYFFSDCATCVVVSNSQRGGYTPGFCRVKPRNLEAMRLRGGGAGNRDYSITDSKAFYEHAGMAVWKETTVQIPSIAKATLEQRGWQASEVDFVLMHQANLRLIEYLMSRLRIPMSKAITTIEEMGNTADASLGTVIHKAMNLDIFNKSSKILLLSVGAGFIFESGSYEVLS